ncbi:MAG: SDR family oxidoreductase [Bacillaceae bacterium]|nr:SDR family oxidoreductase [Bacillaceae bacterium]
MLDNKIVVITGASSGIGRETAKLVAASGGIPVLTARSQDRLNELAVEIKANQYEQQTIVEPPVYRMDVSRTDEVNTVMSKIADRFGRIDVLVNNAGFGVFSYIDNQPIEEYEEMMNVNYLGTVRCVKAVLPYMRRQNDGHIINVASVAGKLGTAKATAYAASKHAVIGFSESLRQELADTQITVSTLCPGPINTPFFDRADPSGDYKSRVQSLMLAPEEVAWEIIDMMIKKPADRTIPGLANFGVKLYHLFPRTFSRLIGKQLNRK